VSSLGSVYHFKDDRIARRSKRSAVDLIDVLNKDPNVGDLSYFDSYKLRI